MSEEKYEVTKEAILKMVEKCPEAKEALKAGFPQAFEEKKHFDLHALKDAYRLFTDNEAQRAGFQSASFMLVRCGHEYDGIAIYLDEDYLKWALKRDSHDRLCLTVERKDT